MGSVNRIVKKSPNFIKWSYYNLVPFHKRYGKVYKETLDFLLHTSKWNEEEKKFYQLMELKSLLAYCYENVSYYRDIFIENKWDPRDFKTVEDLKNFPVLTKKIIIENRDRLIADNRRLDRAHPITTSGSSGDKLEFFVDDDTLKKEAAFNMRAYLEQGAKMYDTPSVWLRRYVPKDSKSPLWYYDH